jgi:hypothetical protein
MAIEIEVRPSVGSRQISWGGSVGIIEFFVDFHKAINFRIQIGNPALLGRYVYRNYFNPERKIIPWSRMSSPSRCTITK